MGATASPHDPKGLIRESFRIEGITAEECRSIFLDWALSLPGDADQRVALVALCETAPAGHPMSEILTAARDHQPLVSRGRRGGRAARLRDD